MDRKIKRILFGTDLTPESKSVFEYVKKLVASTGASIIVAHILEEVNMGTDEMLAHFLGKEKWLQFKEEKIEKAESVLIGKVNENRLIREAIGCILECSNDDLNNQLEDKVIVEEGVPSKKIIELADKNKCDMIIAGREKRKVMGVKHVGGTLKDIIRNSDIPVLIVPYETARKEMHISRK